MNNYSRSSLAILMSVFFFWGFVAASNTVLIGLFSVNFELSQFQGQMVEWAFYISYFVGSLLYLIISVAYGDPLNKIGYKKGLVLGLILSAVGALCFIPAANTGSFPLMLTSLFTIGFGFSLQQIVANPYVIALGDASTGAHRVSMAGGINSFGTTIGPLLLAFALYGNMASNDKLTLETETKKIVLDVNIERSSKKTEMIQGGFSLDSCNNAVSGQNFVVTQNNDFNILNSIYTTLKEKGNGVLVIYRKEGSSLSENIDKLKTENKNVNIPILTINKESLEKISSSDISSAKLNLKMEGVEKVKLPSIILASAFLLFALIMGMSQLPPITNPEKIESGFGALKYPQLVLGMIAIFFYVGTEVTTQSNLPKLLKQENFLGLDPEKTVHFISLYWGCLMIGRWTGALKIFNFSAMVNKLMMVVVPLLAYGVILMVNLLKGSPMNDLLQFLPFVFILIGGFMLSGEKPAKTMMLFGMIAALLMLTGILTEGKLAMYCIISCGLFCSVMWPCIFSLSIAGLGKYTTQGSSFLIMMILGGGIIPLIQGKLADSIGIHYSYLVPLIGFIYLTFYGWKVKHILQEQGINYDGKASSSSGH
jgi:MFS transporter, FHS family, L-fucose permease